MDSQSAIKKFRAAIRKHRDQKGDDRCWVDDYYVWTLLEDTEPLQTTLPSYEEGMQKCRDYYALRRSDTLDVTPHDAIYNPEAWDVDLAAMADEQLVVESEKLRAAIRTHRDITNRKRTIEEDRELYAVLPEKIPADFRLPPENEFLGEAKPHAGCPAFWKSHQTCPCAEHDLHRWGPCCSN